MKWEHKDKDPLHNFTVISDDWQLMVLTKSGREYYVTPYKAELPCIVCEHGVLHFEEFEKDSDIMKYINDRNTVVKEVSVMLDAVEAIREVKPKTVINDEVVGQ